MYPQEAFEPLIPTSSLATHFHVQCLRRTASLGDILIRTLADDQVVFADGVIMAYQLLADASALRQVHVSDPGPLPLDMVHALGLLNAVDAGIAWCEGQLAVTGQIFPSLPALSGSRTGSSLSISQRDAEIAEKSVRGRSRMWPSPAQQQQQDPQQMVFGENRGCYLDFDRWTARQLALRAHCDMKQLWHVRCVAEEAAHRYIVKAEERLDRVTLLVAAYEELSCYAHDAAQAVSPVKRDCAVQATFPDKRDCAVQAGSDALMDRWDEPFLRGPLRTASPPAPSPTPEQGAAPAPLSEARPPVAPLSAFAHGLLRDAEAAGRASCEDKERLSRNLLLAHWDTALAHASNRRLLAAKEEQILATAFRPPVTAEGKVTVAQRICASVEAVERKQIKLGEQRERQMMQGRGAGRASTALGNS